VRRGKGKVALGGKQRRNHLFNIENFFNSMLELSTILDAFSFFYKSIKLQI
jgi:hypothetical protein